MELENMMSKWPSHLEDGLLLYLEGKPHFSYLGNSPWGCLFSWNVGQSASFAGNYLREGKAKLQCFVLYCLSRETKPPFHT